MTEVWGQLSKAQDDDQTVDEAIAAAFAAHEADDSAHVDVGESLYSHKAEAIIDHVAGSVLADKESASEEIYKSFMETLDNWARTGTVSKEGICGCAIVAEDGEFDVSKLETVVVSDGNYLSNKKNMLFQTTLVNEDETVAKVYFGLGWYSSESSFEGIGFYMYNGEVKGFCGFPSSRQFTADFGIDHTILHVYRAQYDKTTKTCTFFVDGVQVGSLSGDPLFDEIEPKIFFVVNRKSIDLVIVRVQNVSISRERP